MHTPGDPLPDPDQTLIVYPEIASKFDDAFSVLLALFVLINVAAAVLL